MGFLRRPAHRADSDPQQEHRNPHRAPGLMRISRTHVSTFLRSEEGGQAVIEMALLLPLMLLLVFGVAELTQAYSVAITISASTREGGRIAGALVNGGGTLGCGGGNSPHAATVDAQIMAAGGGGLGR